MMETKKRIDAIDAARGLALILMVIHHALVDLVVLCGAPWWFYSNPIFDPLHYFFAGLFIFLSGLCCRFSRNNLRRGLIASAIALGITAVTSLPVIDDPIIFGVLHLLGFCMVFFALTRRLWDALPRRAAPFVYITLLLLSLWALRRFTVTPAQARWLFPLGWRSWDEVNGYYPYSGDYFPLLPWIFVFLLGTWAGLYVVERKLPEKFYTFTCPILPAIGRRSLLIYVLHQPILYGIIYAVKQL